MKEILFQPRPFLGDSEIKDAENRLPESDSPQDPRVFPRQLGSEIPFAVPLSAARAGSRDELGVLFEQCRNYLLLMANTALGEGLQAKVAASDLVQETFLEAGRIFERFTGESEEELLRWLTRILENKLGNAVKRYSWSAKRDVSREIPMHPASVADSEDSPSAVVTREEQDVRLRLAIAALPVKYQRVIEFRVQQALSFDEIGRRLNRSAEAARKLFTRAIELLQLRMTADDRPQH